MAEFHDQMIYDSKVILKMSSPSSIHNDLTTFVVDWMVQNIKNWISQEWKMAFLWNKKPL